MTKNPPSSKSPVYVLAFVAAFTFCATPVMAGLFGKSELSGAWKERFQDLGKLKAYTGSGAKVELSDAIIGEYDLTGAVFEGATFRSDEWNETIGKNMTFTNTVFRRNTFTGIDFTGSTFTNVTFEDSDFEATSFYRAKLTGVKFIHCKFRHKSDFDSLEQSTVVFDDSTVDDTSFKEAQAALSFHDSTLRDVQLIGLVFPSSLTMENAKLENVETRGSKLTKLELDHVKGGESYGEFSGANITEMEIRDSALGFAASGATLGRVTFANSKIDAEFMESSIQALRIINCRDMKELKLYKAKVGSLQISNCRVNNIRPVEAVIQNFSVDNSLILNSDFSDMKARNFTLTDVQLDYGIDFTGAQVDNLTTKNVAKLPNLYLTLTGSNLKF